MRNRVPSVPKRQLLFYHWSPTTNRENIKRYGLRIDGKSLQGDGWSPPCVCFSDDPMTAWELSGRMFPNVLSPWDLWMCNVDEQTSFEHYELFREVDPDTKRLYVKEYRVYQRVYKRDLTYIGTRAAPRSWNV